MGLELAGKDPAYTQGPVAMATGSRSAKTHKDDSFCFPFLSFYPNFHVGWNLFLNFFFLGGEAIFDFVTSFLGTFQASM